MATYRRSIPDFGPTSFILRKLLLGALFRQLADQHGDIPLDVRRHVHFRQHQCFKRLVGSCRKGFDLVALASRSGRTVGHVRVLSLSLQNGTRLLAGRCRTISS